MRGFEDFVVGRGVSARQYSVPDEEAGEFLADFPDAVRVETYTVDYGGKTDTYAIPASESEEFRKDFPDAVRRHSIGIERGTLTIDQPTLDAIRADEKWASAFGAAKNNEELAKALRFKGKTFNAVERNLGAALDSTRDTFGAGAQFVGGLAGDAAQAVSDALTIDRTRLADEFEREGREWLENGGRPKDNPFRRRSEMGGVDFAPEAPRVGEGGSYVRDAIERYRKMGYKDPLKAAAIDFEAEVRQRHGAAEKKDAENRAESESRKAARHTRTMDKTIGASTTDDWMQLASEYAQYMNESGQTTRAEKMIHDFASNAGPLASSAASSTLNKTGNAAMAAGGPLGVVGGAALKAAGMVAKQGMAAQEAAGIWSQGRDMGIPDKYLYWKGVEGGEINGLIEDWQQALNIGGISGKISKKMPSLDKIFGGVKNPLAKKVLKHSAGTMLAALPEMGEEFVQAGVSWSMLADAAQEYCDKEGVNATQFVANTKGETPWVVEDGVIKTDWRKVWQMSKREMEAAANVTLVSGAIGLGANAVRRNSARMNANDTLRKFGIQSNAMLEVKQRAVDAISKLSAFTSEDKGVNISEVRKAALEADTEMGTGHQTQDLVEKMYEGITAGVQAKINGVRPTFELPRGENGEILWKQDDMGRQYVESGGVRLTFDPGAEGDSPMYFIERADGLTRTTRAGLANIADTALGAPNLDVAVSNAKALSVSNQIADIRDAAKRTVAEQLAKGMGRKIEIFQTKADLLAAHGSEIPDPSTNLNGVYLPKSGATAVVLDSPENATIGGLADTIWHESNVHAAIRKYFGDNEDRLRNFLSQVDASIKPMSRDEVKRIEEEKKKEDWRGFKSNEEAFRYLWSSLWHNLEDSGYKNRMTMVEECLAYLSSGRALKTGASPGIVARISQALNSVMRDIGINVALTTSEYNVLLDRWAKSGNFLKGDTPAPQRQHENATEPARVKAAEDAKEAPDAATDAAPASAADDPLESLLTEKGISLDSGSNAFTDAISAIEDSGRADADQLLAELAERTTDADIVSQIESARSRIRQRQTKSAPQAGERKTTEERGEKANEKPETRADETPAAEEPRGEGQTPRESGEELADTGAGAAQAGAEAPAENAGQVEAQAEQPAPVAAGTQDRAALESERASLEAKIKKLEGVIDGWAERRDNGGEDNRKGFENQARASEAIARAKERIAEIDKALSAMPSSPQPATGAEADFKDKTNEAAEALLDAESKRDKWLKEHPRTETQDENGQVHVSYGNGGRISEYRALEQAVEDAQKALDSAENERRKTSRFVGAAPTRGKYTETAPNENGVTFKLGRRYDEGLPLKVVTTEHPFNGIADYEQAYPGATEEYIFEIIGHGGKPTNEIIVATRPKDISHYNNWLKKWTALENANEEATPRTDEAPAQSENARGEGNAGREVRAKGMPEKAVAPAAQPEAQPTTNREAANAERNSPKLNGNAANVQKPVKEPPKAGTSLTSKPTQKAAQEEPSEYVRDLYNRARKLAEDKKISISDAINKITTSKNTRKQLRKLRDADARREAREKAREAKRAAVQKTIDDFRRDTDNDIAADIVGQGLSGTGILPLPAKFASLWRDQQAWEFAMKRSKGGRQVKFKPEIGGEPIVAMRENEPMRNRQKYGMGGEWDWLFDMLDGERLDSEFVRFMFGINPLSPNGVDAKRKQGVRTGGKLIHLSSPESGDVHDFLVDLGLASGEIESYDDAQDYTMERALKVVLDAWELFNKWRDNPESVMPEWMSAMKMFDRAREAVEAGKKVDEEFWRAAPFFVERGYLPEDEVDFLAEMEAGRAIDINAGLAAGNDEIAKALLFVDGPNGYWRGFTRRTLSSLLPGDLVSWDGETAKYPFLSYDEETGILRLGDAESSVREFFITEDRAWENNKLAKGESNGQREGTRGDDGGDRAGGEQSARGEDSPRHDDVRAGNAQGEQGGADSAGEAGGGEQGFRLEVASNAEIAGEQKRREERKELQRRTEEPLVGNAGEVNQALMDLGGEEGEDLFNRTMFSMADITGQEDLFADIADTVQKKLSSTFASRRVAVAPDREVAAPQTSAEAGAGGEFALEGDTFEHPATRRKRTNAEVSAAENAEKDAANALLEGKTPAEIAQIGSAAGLWRQVHRQLAVNRKRLQAAEREWRSSTRRSSDPPRFVEQLRESVNQDEQLVKILEDTLGLDDAGENKAERVKAIESAVNAKSGEAAITPAAPGGYSAALSSEVDAAISGNPLLDTSKGAAKGLVDTDTLKFLADLSDLRDSYLSWMPPHRSGKDNDPTWYMPRRHIGKNHEKWLDSPFVPSTGGLPAVPANSGLREGEGVMPAQLTETRGDNSVWVPFTFTTPGGESGKTRKTADNTITGMTDGTRGASTVREALEALQAEASKRWTLPFTMRSILENAKSADASFPRALVKAAMDFAESGESGKEASTKVRDRIRGYDRAKQRLLAGRKIAATKAVQRAPWLLGQGIPAKAKDGATAMVNLPNGQRFSIPVQNANTLSPAQISALGKLADALEVSNDRSMRAISSMLKGDVRTGGNGNYAGGLQSDQALFSMSGIMAEAQRQYDEVYARYHNADGTPKPGWKMAPNGRPTKLTERQWVQVRTENFKRWFGDWEAAALLEMAERAWNDPQFKEKWAFVPSDALAKQLEAMLGHPISQIVITADSVRHIKKHHGDAVAEKQRGQVAMTAEDALLIPYVLDNFDVAIRTPAQDMRDGEKAIEIYKQINGVAIVATIEQGKDKQFVVSGWKKMSAASMPSGNAASPRPNVLNAADKNRIAQEIAEVKRRARDASKVVDENGEPMVVWHGPRTENAFTVFADGMSFFIDNRRIAEMFHDEYRYVLVIDGTEYPCDAMSAEGVARALSYYSDEANEVSEWGVIDIDDERTRETFADEVAHGGIQIGGIDEESFSEAKSVELKKAPAKTLGVFLNIRNPSVIDFGGRAWTASSGGDSVFQHGEGHDGVIAKNIVEGGEMASIDGDAVPPATDFITFSPNQVKSATDNAGTFSESPDIRFSRGDIAKQGALSGGTSRNQNPSGNRYAARVGIFRPGTRNVDIGAGRFDKATEFLAGLGVQNIPFDPVNRGRKENERAAQSVRDNPADTATIHNVLNVIDNDAVMEGIINQAARAIKKDGTAVFSIYEGDRSGNGKATRDGYQRNARTKDYLPAIGKFFGDVEQHGEVIVAKNPKDVGPAFWAFDENFEDGVRFSRGDVSDDVRKAFANDPETRNWTIATNPSVIANLPPQALKILPPVTERTDNNSVEKAMKQLFTDFGEVRNIVSGERVVFNRADAGKMMMQSGADMRTLSPHLKALFENAIPAWSETPLDMPGHTKHPEVVGYRNYVNKFADDGGEKFVRFTVREDNVGRNGVHAATVSNIEVYERKEAEGNDPANKSGATSRIFVDKRLSKFLGKVKENSGDGDVRFSRPDILYSIGGIYTGSAADYANKDENGNIVNGPSLLKIGTGEGAQVYGWGLYGSNRRGVAESYAKIHDRVIDNWRKNGRKVATEIERTTASFLALTHGDVNKAVAAAKEQLDDFDRVFEDADEQQTLDVIRELQEHGNEYLASGRHVYEQTFFTDRAPGDESHLLKWYEPVSEEQKGWIQDELQKENLVTPEAWGAPRADGAFYNYTGPTISFSSGSSLYRSLSKLLGSPQAASEFLARAGIDGIKYPVNSYGGKGVKDGDTAGWNYVSFRDDNIRVDHKWVDGEPLFSLSNILSQDMNPEVKQIIDSANAAARKPVSRGIMDREETALEALTRRTQDAMVPVKALEQDLKVKPEDSPYLAEDRRYGLDEHQTRDLLRNSVRPILDQMQSRGISLGDLDAYLMAKHAPSRNAMIEERTDGKNAAGSGLSPIEANSILSAYETAGKTADLEAVAQMVWDMNKATLARLVSAGLLSQAQADEWTRLSPYYVPLRSHLEDDDFDVNAAITRLESHHALGRSTVADSPLIFSILQAEQAIVRANKNAVRQKLAALVSAHPEVGEILDGQPVKKQLVNGKVRYVVDRGFRERKNLKDIAGQDNVVQFKEGGRLKYIRLFGDRGRLVARAITKYGMYRIESNIGQFVMRVNRFLANTRTSWSPTFLLRNLGYDTQQAVILMNADGLHDEALKYISNLSQGRALRAAYDYYRDGSFNGELGDYMREFVENGGLIKGGTSQGWDETTDIIAQELGISTTRLGRALDKTAATRAAKRVSEVALDRLERVNSSIETQTRLAVYAAMRQAGHGIEESISYARDITVNFNRKGEYGQLLNNYFIFSNAAIQDIARTAETIRRRNAAKFGKNGTRALFTTGTTLLALGFLQGLINGLAGGDDDDDEASMDNITEYTKQSSWYMRAGKKRFVRLGRRGPYALLPYIGTKLSEVWLGKTTPGKASLNIAEMAASLSLDPLNSNQIMMDETGRSIDLKDTVANAVTPTVLDPLIKTVTDRTFTGENLYKKNWNPNLPAAYNGKERTPSTYKDVAQWLNNVSGGDQWTAGHINIAPETLETLWRSLVGSLGSDIARTAGLVRDVAKGELDQPDRYPVARDIVRATPDNTSRFYEAMARQRRYETSAKGYRKSGDRERLRDLVAEHPSITDAKRKQANEIYKRVKLLREREAQLEGGAKERTHALRVKAQEQYIKLIGE